MLTKCTDTYYHETVQATVMLFFQVLRKYQVLLEINSENSEQKSEIEKLACDIHQTGQRIGNNLLNWLNRSLKICMIDTQPVRMYDKNELQVSVDKKT